MDAALASQECELFADMLHQKIDHAVGDFQVDFIQMPGRMWLGPAFAQVHRGSSAQNDSPSAERSRRRP
jgi:hypothetical protein